MTRPPRSNSHGGTNPVVIAPDIGELVARLARRLWTDSATRLAPLGLTVADARALRIVARAGSPLRMSEIARQNRIVPRSATTVIARLEAKGLVVRKIDPEDRRSILVAMTDAGTQLVIEIAQARNQATAALLRRLDSEKRAQLLRLLAELDTASRSERGARRDDADNENSKLERRR
ncbi:MAG: MarR family transcriptional regulator [Acidimicrobiales bacterium]|jgi:DNA-binding MarR family transcriptional regulator